MSQYYTHLITRQDQHTHNRQPEMESSTKNTMLILHQGIHILNLVLHQITHNNIYTHGKTNKLRTINL